MVIALFDLCDTLYAENTTVGFLRFASREEPAIASALQRWLENPLFFLLGAVAQRLGRDLARERLVASLAGLPRDRIEHLASAYAERLEDTRSNTPLLVRLDEHRKRGDRVVIVSSSLAPVVEAVASRLGVEGHGSTLGFTNDGRCTGKITKDLTGAKPAIAAGLRGEGEWMIVYSDNRTDEELLRSADEGFVVLPAGKKTRWAGNDVNYIQL
ncbi:HAD superfamily phosphoserine phosphatase-like hydrolase [Sphingomonas kaistensis]|uniref:HAD superfamily phosphoserine phosphatase-like hydrolase n=1 Tax=Sphingomonas kaistensis TaxID=298708 RepID=A0A7X5Y772_9SPHN|nr:HAD-IB family phosphatase [Sphingomonas kaistensis]NJC06478.1 HAD superfamily phosphoserine phosphatase-like hydrolase [Sphingomonas kaistensis]